MTQSLANRELIGAFKYTNIVFNEEDHEEEKMNKDCGVT